MTNVDYCPFCGSTEVSTFEGSPELTDDIVVECESCDEHCKVVSHRFADDP